MTPDATAGNHPHDPESHAVHAVPAKVLLGVWAALMILTLLTVAATWVQLGRMNLVLAMVIATIKAGLVALYFMHLRYENPFHGFLLIVGLGFVALFIAFAIGDTRAYSPDFVRPASTYVPPPPVFTPSAKTHE